MAWRMLKTLAMQSGVRYTRPSTRGERRREPGALTERRTCQKYRSSGFARSPCTLPACYQSKQQGFPILVHLMLAQRRNSRPP